MKKSQPEFRFAGTLPKGFVLSKPIQQCDEKAVYALERAGRLIITRKRDGWKLFAAFDAKGKVRLYTDGINEVDDRLASVRKELESLDFEPRTLVSGEILVESNGVEELGAVGSLMQGGGGAKPRGDIKFMPFGVVFYDATPVTQPYRDVITNMNAVIKSRKRQHVLPLEVLDVSFDEAKKLVDKNGWEGLVLYDANFRYGYRLDDKSPERITGCWKWKPRHEDDFIVRGFVPRPDGTVKELLLSQFDPTSGQEFYCGKFGALTKQDRVKYAAKAQYPFVVQVTFEARYPKSGKIRIPHELLRVREDKKIADCLSPKSFPEPESV